MAKKAGKKAKKKVAKTSARKTTKKSASRSSTQTASAASINMDPPRAVQKALEKGLELRKDYGGKGLVANTITWARKLAKGAPISPDKARKMHAYFSRHKVDRKPGWEDPPTPGYVAWLLWGGDAGRAWSERLVKKLDKA